MTTAIVAALLAGLIVGAAAWELLRRRLSLPDVNGREAQVALVSELRAARDAAVKRADAAELRMRDVEQMLLEVRANAAGVSPPPAVGERLPTLPTDLLAEIAEIEEPEARAEMEAAARTLIEAGRSTPEIIAELFG